jgi:two-component system, NarL family, nitrate/nitrite response regulator NarL
VHATRSLTGSKTRDKQLWRLIALGMPTEDIAGRLLVSERTAKRMVATLLRRIGADNRVHAAALAGRCGLLDEDMDSGP